MTQLVRPGIEAWLATASPEQRIAVDEFVGVLTHDGDSGSLWSTLEAAVAYVGIDHVLDVLRLMESLKAGKEEPK